MIFQDAEQPIFIFRPHWILAVRAFFIWSLAPLFAGGFLGVAIVFDWMPAFFMASFLFLFSVHSAFIYAMSRFHSVWVLTNQRLIEVQYLPYVKHETRSLFVHEIHEIEEKSTGFLQRILGYGHVRIKMPTVQEELSCYYVPQPEIFAQTLDAIHQKAPTSKTEIQNLQKELAKRYRLEYNASN